MYLKVGDDFILPFIFRVILRYPRLEMGGYKKGTPRIAKSSRGILAHFYLIVK